MRCWGRWRLAGGCQGRPSNRDGVAQEGGARAHAPGQSRVNPSFFGGTCPVQDVLLITHAAAQDGLRANGHRLPVRCRRHSFSFLGKTAICRPDHLRHDCSSRRSLRSISKRGIPGLGFLTYQGRRTVTRGPVDAPPCIRHRPFAIPRFWHGCPLLVFAPHSGVFLPIGVGMVHLLALNGLFAWGTVSSAGSCATQERLLRQRHLARDGKVAHFASFAWGPVHLRVPLTEWSPGQAGSAPRSAGWMLPYWGTGDRFTGPGEEGGAAQDTVPCFQLSPTPSAARSTPADPMAPPGCSSAVRRAASATARESKTRRTLSAWTSIRTAI